MTDDRGILTDREWWSKDLRAGTMYALVEMLPGTLDGSVGVTLHPHAPGEPATSAARRFPSLERARQVLVMRGYEKVP